MSGKTVDGLELGMAAELAKTYDEWDIYTFAALTGDLNPAHVDQAFAEKSIFKGKIAHGMLTASLISAVLGTKLPGPGCIYLAQDLEFLRPVRIGDTVTARVEVIKLVRDKNLVTLKTTCTNQSGERLLDGIALVMPPKIGATDQDRDTAAPETPPMLPPAPGRESRAQRPRPKRRGIRVDGRMTPDPLTISPDAAVSEAKALLDRHGVRHLPVVEGNHLVGIITDSDIRQASLPGSAGNPAKETEALLALLKVRDVMRREVLTISPGAGIGEAARLLLSRKAGGLVVVEGERVVGIITVTDALEALAEITEV